jgi:5-oxoprolinase (ATP-hydrolysing) subunit C
MTATAHLVIEEAGPATSVQDGGRFGAQRYGLGTAGAMDIAALAAGNALTGSARLAAAIEIGPFAARVRARGGAVRIALTGATRPATLGERLLSFNTTSLLADGEVLSLGFAKSGVFTYLTVEGGIQAPPVMGSLSVHQRAGLGSPYARPLKAGDSIPVLAASGDALERMLTGAVAETGPIRVVLGPQDDYFAPGMIMQFLATPWRVSALSDRMGYRLEGPRLSHAKGFNIVSDGIAHGTIQIPGNGLPLVLLSDRGTTGGYPKIATIITADLGRMGQTGVGQSLRFQAVTIEQAQGITREFAADVAALSGRVVALRTTGIDEASLHGANVAGAAVSATDEL